MNTKIIAYLWLFILIVTELVGETFLTKWVKESTINNMYFGVFCYMLIPFLFITVIRHFNNNLVIANSIWQASNLIIATIIGIYIFNESITKCQYVGIAFAVIANILLMY